MGQVLNFKKFICKLSHYMTHSFRLVRVHLVCRPVATEQVQRQKTRKNIKNVTEPKKNISTLVKIESVLQIREPITLTTRLIASFQVNESLNCKLRKCSSNQQIQIKEYAREVLVPKNKHKTSQKRFLEVQLTQFIEMQHRLPKAATKRF